MVVEEEEEVLFLNSMKLVDNGESGGVRFGDMIQIPRGLGTIGMMVEEEVPFPSSLQLIDDRDCGG